MPLLEDRRKQLRRPFQRPVTVYFSEWELEATCLNVSPTGCFLAGHGFPGPGEPIIILFPADGYDAVIECVGVVRRLVLPSDPGGQPPGGGVQFVEAMCRDGMVTLGKFLQRLGVDGIDEMWKHLEAVAPRAPIYSYDFGARRMVGRLPLEGEEASHHGNVRERVRMNMAFGFRDGDARGSGIMANISPTGAFIRSSFLPQLGSVIELLMPMKGGGEEVVHAEVRWRSQGDKTLGTASGFGVRFVDRDAWAADQQRFHAFIGHLRK